MIRYIPKNIFCWIIRNIYQTSFSVTDQHFLPLAIVFVSTNKELRMMNLVHVNVPFQTPKHCMFGPGARIVS